MAKTKRNKTNKPKPFKSSVGNSDNYWEYQNQKSRSTYISPLSKFSSLYLWWLGGGRGRGEEAYQQ